MDSSEGDLQSLKPIADGRYRLRERLDLKDEILLAILPTGTVLAVLGMVEVLTEQRLLFASLASSAFLIYLDPEHGTNAVRTLILAHAIAALAGWATYSIIGAGYLSGGSAMVVTIFLLILVDAVHPPAVATAMGFGLRAGEVSNLALFGLAVAITAVLVIMQRAALRLLAWTQNRG